jgi:outer membrane immunogenic protein
LASAGAVALAGSAFAADLPMRAPPPVYMPPPFSWTGLYLGGQVGYAFGSIGSSTLSPAGFDFFYPNQFNYSPQGVIGGAHLGYNLQIGQWLLGLEGDVDGTGLSRTYAAPFGFFGGGPLGFGASVHTKLPVQGSIRLRAGLAWDRALLYATGGAAFAGVKTTYASFFGYDSISKTRAGWTVGGGIEYAITDNWSIRGEYRYADFGRYTDILINSATFAGTSVHSHLTENRVQLGISYKLGAAPATVVAKY